MTQLHLHTGDGHRLEADETLGHGPAIVLCHPDPRHGGNRNHSIIDAIYRAAVETGRAALRFDFRPDPADHLEAVADLRAAVAHLTNSSGPAATPSPGSPANHQSLHLAGYSFGAVVAAAFQHQDPASVASLSLIAPAAQIDEPNRTPTQLILATHDQFIDSDTLKASASQWQRPPEVVELHQADHFLLGASTQVAEAVCDFIERCDRTGRDTA